MATASIQTRARCSIDSGLPADSAFGQEDMEPDDVVTDIGHLTLNESVAPDGTSPKKPTDLEAALTAGRLDLADYFWRAHHTHNRGQPLIAYDLMKAAIQSRQLPVIRFLTERNVSVNCTDRNGETPLHQAAQTGCLDIVEYLATAGAQIDAVDCVSQLQGTGR
ncbi:unnamed protein product [Echinostoma caproni]|uniref:ANK_REP_REGION domain-containing protein n=1 Tax=Echinostoma caproni TaxID=27848 RepID=A0A183B120_9TREM|nr:unnamed protein product [Echinostoma caproni]